MKAVWTVISSLLLINALLLAGAVGWLYQSGRINKDRIERIREMLEITIEQEQQLEIQAKEAEEQTRQKTLEIARLESVSDGPITLADRLKAKEQGDELAVQRVKRLRRDISDLRRQLVLAKEQITKQHDTLLEQRQQFQQSVLQQTKLKEDQDFQKAVSMYQKVKPKQAKEMFQQMLLRGQLPQVVDYLAAMQLRKAAAVLKQFKNPDEIIQATDLLHHLRQRGIEMPRQGLSGIQPATNGVNAPADG